MKGLRVLVLGRDSLVAPGVESLSVSARISEIMDYLEYSLNVDYIYVSEEDPCVNNAVIWSNVIILNKHRSAKSFQLVKFASSLFKGLIYDLDDWIFSFPSYSAGSIIVQNYSLDIISYCDYVTVSNMELIKILPKFIPNANLVYMPNGMWIERYEEYYNNKLKSPSSLSNKILFTNADFLKVENSKDDILTALNVFFLRHPDLVLDFFGDPFPEMFSLPFLHFTSRTPYQTYMQTIMRSNYLFAISPLGASEDIDSLEFNRCKNPFKYINYSVARIPGIYSSADIYINCVQNGITGLLVENNYHDWLNAMELYLDDSNLRNRVIDASYQHVKYNFHISKSAFILSNLILKLTTNKSVNCV